MTRENEHEASGERSWKRKVSTTPGSKHGTQRPMLLPGALGWCLHKRFDHVEINGWIVMKCGASCLAAGLVIDSDLKASIRTKCCRSRLVLEDVEDQAACI